MRGGAGERPVRSVPPPRGGLKRLLRLRAPGRRGEASRVIDWLELLYATRGTLTYGEGVSQREHALQAAHLAEQVGCGPSLIVAALLHDLGHLLDRRGEDAAARGIDTRHEAIAAGLLARLFGEAVAAPVRLHVDAKRYRCAIDPDYRARLSPASAQSLALQGGPMSPAEAATFEARPDADAALRLRGWDEAAKRTGVRTPAFAHFRPYLRAALRA